MDDTAKHKFILVVGHESSGTHLVANAVVQATGFDYDDGENRITADGKLDSYRSKTVQRWWGNPDEIAYDKPRVSRRSLPHGGVGLIYFENMDEQEVEKTFLDPMPLITGLKRVGYDVRVVLTVRDRTVAIKSKCREHTQGDLELATKEMDDAVAIMNRVIEEHDQCFVCSYEALMTLGTPYLQELYAFLGIQSDHEPVMKDGNRKYIPAHRTKGSALEARSIFSLEVGIVARGNAGQWGGDLRALQSAKDGLEELGVRVRLAKSAADVTDCDFVFLSNTPVDQRRNACFLLDNEVPYGIFAFHQDFPAHYPQAMGFAEFISLSLQGGLDNGVTLRIEDLWKNPGLINYYNQQIPRAVLYNLEVMSNAAVCVASSHREARTMERDCPACKTAVVYWNIPLLSQGAGYSDEFLKLTGLAKGEYILQVGRLETRKNQLATLLSTKNLDIPVVLIATKGYQQWYDLLVVNAAAKHRKAPTLLISEEHPTQNVGGEMRIIQMPRGERLSESCLLSAYQNCGLHMHPAFWESPGYTYLEAAKAGVPTVASEWGTVQDYCEFGDNDASMDGRMAYVRPYDLPQMEEAVRQNFGKEVSSNFTHPIFERTEKDVGRDVAQCLVRHAT